MQSLSLLADVFSLSQRAHMLAACAIEDVCHYYDPHMIGLSAAANNF